jgi:hypothetical protein
MATRTISIRLKNEEEAQVARKLYRMLIHDGTAALVGPDNSKIDLPPTIYPSCAENPAVQGGDVERGERSSPCAKIFS